MCLLFVLPPGITPDDSTYTNISLSAGSGIYLNTRDRITRRPVGCSYREDEVTDYHENPFTEYNFSITHKLNYPFKLGLNSSYVNFTKTEVIPLPSETIFKSKEYSTYILHPMINFDTEFFELGGGGLFAGDNMFEGKSFKPSGYLRLGKMSNFYIDASYYHIHPLLSGGFTKIGICWNTRKAPIWIGLGIDPYENWGLLVRSNFEVRKKLFLDVFFRVPSTDPANQYSINLGIGYRFSH